MRINVGYSSSLPKRRLAFLDRLSPTRRAEVEKALSISDNEALTSLLNHIDDPDPTDGVMALLRGEDFKDKVLAGAAGRGYRSFSPERVKQKNHPDFGRTHMIADEPTNYPPEEQRLLELLALSHERDYVETGNIVPIDTNDPLYKRIERATNDISTSSKKGLFAEGGISPDRAKHPDLPPLTEEIVQGAPARFLYDNLVGNERQEQPITSVDKKGNRSSLPIEHKTAFNNAPQLGRELDNRMVGSTLKNSVLRSEEDPSKQVELLSDNLMHGYYDFIEDFGRTPQEAMNSYRMRYSNERQQLPRFAGILRGNKNLSDNSRTVINADTVDIDGDAYISS